MSHLLRTLKILSRMAWPPTDKQDVGTFEVRLSYSDEGKFRSELWEQCVNEDRVCDVTLKLDDGSEMKAHWCILLLCPYFKALHSSGLWETQTSKLDLTIAPAKVIRIVIEFLYCGRALVPKHHIKDVIHCSDYLQIDNLKSRCADYLKDNKLDFTNCVSMCALANTYNLEALYEESNRILRRRFKEVMLKDDILQLLTESLKFLMTDKNLRYVGQLEMFKLLVRWTEYSDERKREFHDLFKLIDLNDISSEMVEKVVKNNALVSEDSRCVSLVNLHEDAQLGSARNNAITKEVLVLVSQKQTEADLSRSTACYGYVIQDDRWVRLSNLPKQMSGQLSVKNETDLYVLGREDKTQFTRLYKLPKNEVKDYWLLCSLEQPRTLSEEIYATVFCKDKLVSVRRDNMRLFVCSHNPNAPNETTVKNLMFLRSPKEVGGVRLCCYKDRFVFILILTSRNRIGAQQNKTLLLDIENNVLDIPEMKGTCVGELLYMEEERIFLETPGKRFSNMFDMEKRHWSTVRRGLPPLPNNLSLKDVKSVKYNDDLIIIGGINVINNTPSRDVFRLRRKSQVWEKMTAPPPEVALLNGSSAMFAIPRELLRCPHDCTHCAPRFIPSEYADSYDDDDDDDDDDAVGDEDSMYGFGYSDSEEDYYDDAPPFFFW